MPAVFWNPWRSLGPLPITSISWTEHTTTITSWSVKGLAWNGSVYCAVGQVGGRATTICYTSPDGSTCNAQTIQSGTWQAIVWAGTTFIAVTESTQAATSTNGITWTSRTTTTSNNQGTLATNGAITVMIGGANTSYTTNSGVSWTGGTIPGSGDHWLSMAFGGSAFVAVGMVANNGNITRSTDGVTWSTPILITGSTNLSQFVSIAWNGTVFCAITTADTFTATSPDGITWTPHTLPSNYAWTSITSIGTTFCIVNSSNNNTYISQDGITWTLFAIPGTSGQFAKISNNNTNFLTMGTLSPVITATTP